jgi:hypothetical protein
MLIEETAMRYLRVLHTRETGEKMIKKDCPLVHCRGLQAGS